MQQNLSVLLRFKVGGFAAFHFDHLSLLLPVKYKQITRMDCLFAGDEENEKKDAGKWWKPWVSRPGGERRNPSETS